MISICNMLMYSYVWRVSFYVLQMWRIKHLYTYLMHDLCVFIHKPSKFPLVRCKLTVYTLIDALAHSLVLPLFFYGHPYLYLCRAALEVSLWSWRCLSGQGMVAFPVLLLRNAHTHHLHLCVLISFYVLRTRPWFGVRWTPEFVRHTLLLLDL